MSKKLFVGSLDWNVTDADLSNAFAPFGNVLEAKVILDRDSGRSRGFGFVTLEDASQADAAIADLDGKELHGRAIRVNEANERPSGSRGGGGGGGGGGGDRGGGGGGNRNRERGRW